MSDEHPWCYLSCVFDIKSECGCPEGPSMSRGVVALDLIATSHVQSDHVDEIAVSMEQLGKAGHVMAVPGVDKA